MLPNRAAVLAADCRQASGQMTVQMTALSAERTMGICVQEIGQFVAANWTQLEDKESNSTYFYNQITHRTQFDQPIQPQRVCYSLL